MRYITKVGALVVAAVLVLSSCGSGGGGGAKSAKDLTIAMISHGGKGDTFWDVVKSGEQRAGKDLGVKTTYDSSDDVNQQADMIDAAVNKKVDGIIVSMAEPDGLQASIQRAVAAHIPVVTINSGLDQSKAFGAITHVGQSEGIAGEAAGEKFKTLGAKHILCVIHEAGNVGLEDRCKGAAKTFGGQVENLQVAGADTAKAADAISAKLQSDSSVDGVLTLNNLVALGAAQAIDKTKSKAELGTFDLSSDVLSEIKNSKIAFAIDQQPYVQGYLPVVLLYLKAINGNDVGGGLPINSGPAFVTKENADKVADFAKQGTR